MKDQPILATVLRGIALAMGIAALVLGILGTATVDTMITLLSIGLAALALWAFRVRN
jgi:hypothetical protein